MDYLIGIICSALPAIVVGIFMWWFTRGQKRRDTKIERRAEHRRQESMLALEMQFATAKLAYSTAFALKRGSANGEVEEGIKAYHDAKAKYTKFLNEQAKEYLS